MKKGQFIENKLNLVINNQIFNQFWNIKNLKLIVNLKYLNIKMLKIVFALKIWNMDY